MSALEPGLLIANRFRLQRLLGQGGMGSVWTAWHVRLNIEVAIKFIDVGADAEASADTLARFEREATAAARTKSPHVVSILDHGTDESGRPYIAMEQLQGEDLSKRLGDGQTLAVPVVARIVYQACKGLSRAHAEGIVHRDIKPENVFLCEDEDGFIVKLLDFGIAKETVTSARIKHRTETGMLIGTPFYMSPEQALGDRAIDARSDLYSLAVVAYRCLTGRVPFFTDAIGSLIVAITSKPHLPPSEYRDELPRAVDDWMARALAKAPADRFPSAKAMADAFNAACGLSSPVMMDGDSGSLPPAARGPVASFPDASPLDKTKLNPTPAPATVRDATTGDAGASQPSGSTLRGTTANGRESAASIDSPSKKPLVPIAIGASILAAAALAFFALRGRNEAPAPTPDSTTTRAASAASSAPTLASDAPIVTAAEPAPSPSAAVVAPSASAPAHLAPPGAKPPVTTPAPPPPTTKNKNSYAL